MFNLTRQEKTVLLFIALAAFAGITINFIQKNNPRFKEFLTRVPSEIVSRVNINKATSDELVSLPGIGEGLATRIMDYRKKNGRFETLEEIRNVKGIGEHKFELIKDYISLE